jgi:hypothetical protein
MVLPNNFQVNDREIFSDLVHKGNSIISFINDEQIYPNQFQLLQKAQKIIQEKNFGNKYIMLPPSSFHITMKDLLCDKVRDHQSWSSKLQSDIRFSEADIFVQEQSAHPIQQIQHNPLILKYAFMDHYANSIKLSLIPNDEDTKRALRKFRDEVSLKTGIKHGNHEDYRYHITLCYLFRRLNGEEENELNEVLGQLDDLFRNELGLLTLQPPQLTFFEDMFEFKLKR